MVVKSLKDLCMYPVQRSAVSCFLFYFYVSRLQEWRTGRGESSCFHEQDRRRRVSHVFVSSWATTVSNLHQPSVGHVGRDHRYKMSFPLRVAGLSRRDRARSSVTLESLRVESLLLHMERSQFRWSGNVQSLQTRDIQITSVCCSDVRCARCSSCRHLSCRHDEHLLFFL